MGNPRDPFGPYLYPYAINALREKVISPREAILLAHVDCACNPFWIERRNSTSYGIHCFSINRLKTFLRCDYRTVLLIIKKLSALDPWLLKSERCQTHRNCWKLWTRELSKTNENDVLDEWVAKCSIYLEPGYLLAFENGKMSLMELLVSCVIKDDPKYYVDQYRFFNILDLSKRYLQKTWQHLIEKKYLKRKGKIGSQYLEMLDHPDFHPKPEVPEEGIDEYQYEDTKEDILTSGVDPKIYAEIRLALRDN